MSQRLSEGIKSWESEPVISLDSRPPLFDPENNGEMALDFLDTLSPDELFVFIFPVIFSCVWFEIEEQIPKPFTHSVIEKLNLELQKMPEIQMGDHFSEFSSVYLAICDVIEESMFNIGVMQSLIENYPDFAQELYEKKCIRLPALLDQFKNLRETDNEAYIISVKLKRNVSVRFHVLSQFSNSTFQFDLHHITIRDVKFPFFLGAFSPQKLH